MPSTLSLLGKTAALAAALALGACGGSSGSRDGGAPRPDASIGDAPFASAPARQCLADLRSKQVSFEPLPNRSFGGGCRTIDTIKLLDIGMPTTNLGALTCPLASNFAAWARYAVQPAGRQILGAEVVRIETFGSYACRNVNGASAGKLSQHAFANAIDVSAFVLADGRRVTVLGGWQGGERERAFLRALHDSACRRFGTVLGPDYNGAHANHFHFDMSGGGYCR